MDLVAHVPSFAELWKTRINRSPNADFLVSRDRTWSCREFDNLVITMIDRLDTIGARLGEGIAIQGPNTVGRIALHFAAQICHMVTIPLLEGLTPTECGQVVRHSAPSWVFTTPHGTALGTGTLVLEEGDEIILNRRKLLTAEDKISMSNIVDRDAGWIIYTSGSSGSPKGVVLPRSSFASCGKGYSSQYEINEHDRLLLCFPMGHAIGTHTIPSVALVAGASIGLIERFSVSKFWRDVQELGATVAILFPSQLTLLSNAADDVPSSPLRLIITHEIHAEFASRFPQVELATVWGMTETGVIGTGARFGSPGRLPNLVGTPMPVQNAEVGIIDHHGQPQNTGEPGEIVFRNPVGQMLEYFREPALTALTLVDGWVHSGDLGVLTTDGLVFQGRLKNIIKRAGETILADEIEHVLENHPAVSECAVCAVPDPIYTEEVGAVVFVKAGTDVDLLRAWLQTQLAAWKVPRFWLIIGQPLPRLENHKIARQKILEMLLSSEDAVDFGGRQVAPAARNLQ